MRDIGEMKELVSIASSHAVVACFVKHPSCPCVHKACF